MLGKIVEILTLGIMTVVCWSLALFVSYNIYQIVK